MTDPVVWLNGTLLPQSEALVSPLTRGCLFGFGIYETLAVRNGLPCDLQAHLDRLREGQSKLSLQGPDSETLAEAIASLCTTSGLTEARVRITLAAGVSDSGSSDCLITAIPLVPPKSAASVVTVPWRRNERSPLAGIKCTACPDNILAQQYATAAGADEGIFLNTRDELCEGAFSNIFLVRSGELLTPPLSSGCLPGITRASVIRRAETLGIPCLESSLHDDDWLRYAGISEVFLTSSIRGIQPVFRIDGSPLAAPGPVTRRLMAGGATELVR